MVILILSEVRFVQLYIYIYIYMWWSNGGIQKIIENLVNSLLVGCHKMWYFLQPPYLVNLISGVPLHVVGILYLRSVWAKWWKSFLCHPPSCWNRCIWWIQNQQGPFVFEQNVIFQSWNTTHGQVQSHPEPCFLRSLLIFEGNTNSFEMAELFWAQLL